MSEYTAQGLPKAEGLVPSEERKAISRKYCMKCRTSKPVQVFDGRFCTPCVEKANDHGSFGERARSGTKD